jgi:protein-tyrosine kinase
MSKFFEDTEKIQQSTFRSPVAGPFDIGSLVKAIKQSEDAGVQDSRRPNLRQVDVSKGMARLPINLESDEPAVARALEAYRSLRTRVMKMQASKGIHSIMITSSIPNEGKTITALHLAVCCSQLHDIRILLVDAHLRSTGLTQLLQATNEAGLSDFLSGKSPVEDAIISTDRKNLFFVAAGSSNSQPTELFAGPRWSKFLGRVDESFDIVLVDGPPIFSFTDAELIANDCDGALMVVKACSTPREMAQKCVSRLPPKKLIGAVFNGVPDGLDGR